MLNIKNTSKILKQQYVSFISVGGAKEHHWVSFGLPSLQCFAFPTHMKVVGQVDVFGATAFPERQAALEQQCKDLGAATVAAIGKDPKTLPWLGDKGVCPLCHGRHLTVKLGTDQVECPVCGMTGTLSIVDGQIQVAFSEDAMYHSRFSIGGLIDHCIEIQGGEPECAELFGDNSTVYEEVFNG